MCVRDEGSGLSELHQRLAFDWFHSGEPPKEPTYTYSGTFSCIDFAFPLVHIVPLPALSHLTAIGDFGGKFTGLGVGLPLSKVYSLFYGGHISLSSNSLSGLTASAVLQRLGDATIEL